MFSCTVVFSFMHTKSWDNQLQCKSPNWPEAAWFLQVHQLGCAARRIWEASWWSQPCRPVTPPAKAAFSSWCLWGLGKLQPCEHETDSILANGFWLSRINKERPKCAFCIWPSLWRESVSGFHSWQVLVWKFKNTEIQSLFCFCLKMSWKAGNYSESETHLRRISSGAVVVQLTALWSGAMCLLS